MYFTIVIDCDRGHCYEHLKKNYDENWACDIDLNVCVCNEFWTARNGKKWSFGLFRPNLPQLGYFIHILYLKLVESNFNDKNGYFGSKWANMANFENKIIENSKIQNVYIARLLFIKTEIRQVYNPF